jgi:hypothetical protein
MANPVDMVKYLFGVSIVAGDDVLFIEDRRPTFMMFLSVAFAITVVVIAGWTWFTSGIKIDVFTVGLTVVAFGAAAYFCTRGNYRETYIFNRKTDSFVFTRQSVLNKDVLEGSASQFRAVQVELRTGSGNDDREYYMVALLCQGLLFGQSDTQILREDPPMLNTRATANRIANAISKFLDIPRRGTVEVI